MKLPARPMALAMTAMGFVACSGAGSGASSIPGEERWTIEDGSWSIVLPSDWSVSEERTDEFHVIESPSGDGVIRLIEIEDLEPPAAIDEAYALAQGLKANEIASLPTDEIRVYRAGPSHYVASADGVADGGLIAFAAHVWGPGRIVIGFYNSADPDDPHLVAARRILASVWPGQAD